MTLLPTTKTKPKNQEPGRLFVYGQSKVGKTTALARLPGNLIIDLEEGTKYLETFAVNIVQQLRDDPDGKMKTPIGMIRLLLKELAKDESGQFKSITFDTADWLEIFMGNEIARQEGVDDYRDLEYGRGYALVRDAIIAMLDAFAGLGLNVIVIAHRKKTVIGEAGREVTVVDVDLTGKLKNFMFGWADAIGYMHRTVDEKNSNIVTTALNFKSDIQEALEGGCRIERLANKSVNLITYDTDKMKVISSNWEEIFPSLKE